jgi:putative aminopeptidase FrvX
VSAVVSRDALFESIRTLTALHSPSGVEREMDEHLAAALAAHGEPRTDGAGNIIVSMGEGSRGRAALLAHKDEIGGIVKRVEEDGRLRAQTLGDAHPWIWGEGPVEVLGRAGTVLGVLSFGARHVSDESPQRTQLDDAPVKWKDAWIETKLGAEALAAAGVTAGSRVVAARSRKQAVRLGERGEYVASYALDDKVAVAMLLELAARVPEPARPVDLVFTAREEVGCQGSQYYTRRTDAEVLVALEVVPVAKEYAIDPGPDPVLIRADAYGPLDDGVSDELADSGTAAGVGVRHAVVSRYGSDASTSIDTGRIARSACLAVATENTHGFEIAHLDAVEGCVRILERWLAGGS